MSGKQYGPEKIVNGRRCAAHPNFCARGGTARRSNGGGRSGRFPGAGLQSSGSIAQAATDRRADGRDGTLRPTHTPPDRSFGGRWRSSGLLRSACCRMTASSSASRPAVSPPQCLSAKWRIGTGGRIILAIRAHAVSDSPV